LSISLSEEDVKFLENYARSQGLASRSAALQKAISVLRVSSLGPAYDRAWQEWQDEDSGVDWEPTTGDGLGD
ncbi:MAG: antitoxin, partial [Actinomycetota bacterium]